MKNLKLMGHQLTRNEMRTIDGGTEHGKARVYCRCIGGMGGEGFTNSCSTCVTLCQWGYICTG